VKIALLSLDQAWENKEKNIKKCDKLLALASKNGASIAIMPEMTLTGYTLDDKLAEEFEYSSTLLAFQNLSKTYAITTVFGMMIKKDNKLLNRLVVVDKNGETIGFYDKIHPFSLVGEDKIFQAGNEPMTLQLNGVGVSFSICYDLRFPEIFSLQSASSAIYVNIAN
jgi:predicted amidohydrolase